MRLFHVASLISGHPQVRILVCKYNITVRALPAVGSDSMSVTDQIHTSRMIDPDATEIFYIRHTLKGTISIVNSDPNCIFPTRCVVSMRVTGCNPNKLE